MGLLTRRKPKQVQQGSTHLAHQFAFVDVETTGLDARVDRVIEIAVVITDAAGTVIDEWCSLVRPDVDKLSAGPTRIHLIETDWLRAAPTFKDLSSQIAHRLNGRVIVAHNARFDVEFLEEEFKRAGISDDDQGEWTTLCTVQLARAVDVPRRLADACYALGVKYEKHSAIGDARACSQLLHRFMSIIDPSTFAGGGVTTFGALPELVMVRPVARQEAATSTTARPVLEALVAALPPHDSTLDRDPAATDTYLVALQDAIADGYISAEEVQSLTQIASRFGLTGGEIRDLHQELVLRLIDTALHDRRISKAERADIERAAAWLNVDVSDWDVMVKAARVRAKADVDAFKAEVKGAAVAFTGAGIFKANVREAFAAKHQLRYQTTVGDDTDLLVVGSELTDTLQVEKARERGLPVIVEATFWRRLGEV